MATDAGAPVAVLRVALDVPLRRTFDYLPPAALTGPLVPGTRVRVPFGRGTRVGVVLEGQADTSIDPSRLRRIAAVLDDAPLWPGSLLGVIEWAARYYEHPVGEVVSVAMPAGLRAGRVAAPAQPAYWRVVPGADAPRRAPRQAALLAWMRAHGAAAVAEEAMRAAAGADAGPIIARLRDRGLIEPATAREPFARDPAHGSGTSDRTLTAAQGAAVESIEAARGRFETFLLEGVTGSGKTEVYLAAALAAAARGAQTLVLVPEIGLTAQMLSRCRELFGTGRVAVLHSGLPDGERLRAWAAARSGTAAVVVGTRSAVWVPLARPGLIVVDEEHDLSYKQQDGLRYSARDVAVMRAQREAVPVVLGSATPALETLYNAVSGRYRHLQLPARVGGGTLPAVRYVDVAGQRLEHGLAPQLVAAARAHLDQGAQVLLFINRRGYSHAAVCTSCGEARRCERCDARLVYHKAEDALRCHHCGAQRPFQAGCPGCGLPLLPLGHGTERIEEALRASFPGRRIVRIDRDSTRRRGELEAQLALARDGTAQVLVGTQMLSKGHHFPGVSLVGVVDTDQRLYGVDFRAAERLAQLLLQVAGRAGRAGRPGEVLIQTRFPGHPLFRTLFDRGYHALCSVLIDERREAGLPPFRHLAVLRAEAKLEAPVTAFLEHAAAQARVLADGGIRLFGPVPATMTRRAGNHRAQLLLDAPDRASRARLLHAWIGPLEAAPQGRRVRWSIDVDPQELG
ncbi:MAG: primosomal protein N' [Gammaproteobacteria bacterium]